MTLLFRAFITILVSIILLTGCGGGAGSTGNESALESNESPLDSDELIDVRLALDAIRSQSSLQDFARSIQSLEATEPTVTTADTQKNLTVFAPSDIAFSQLNDSRIKALFDNKSQLHEFLSAHFVFDEHITTSSLSSLIAVETENEAQYSIHVEDNQVFLQAKKQIPIVETVELGNVMIHIIDEFLLPSSFFPADEGTIMDLLSLEEQYSVFFEELIASDWALPLGNADRYWRVLALDNSSMDNVDPPHFSLEDHLVEETSQNPYFKYYGVKYALSGAELSFDFLGGPITHTVNGSYIPQSVVSPTNGVVHELRYPAVWGGGTPEMLAERLDRLQEDPSFDADSVLSFRFFAELIRASDEYGWYDDIGETVSLLVPKIGTTRTQAEEQVNDLDSMYQYYAENQALIQEQGFVTTMFRYRETALKFLLAHTLEESASTKDILRHIDNGFGLFTNAHSVKFRLLNENGNINPETGLPTIPELGVGDSKYLGQAGIAQNGYIHQIDYTLLPTVPFAKRIPYRETNPVHLAIIQAGNFNKYLDDYLVGGGHVEDFDSYERTYFIPTDEYYPTGEFHPTIGVSGGERILVDEDGFPLAYHQISYGVLTPSELLAAGTITTAGRVVFAVTGTVDELYIGGYRATFLAIGASALYSIDGLLQK